MFKSGCSKNKVKTLKRPICTHTHYLLKSKIKKAFTLAEVLITVGIIGIIAGMTIPSVLSNIKHQQLKSGFQKSYSIISQAVLQTKMELGVENLKAAYATYDGTSYPHAQEFQDAFYKQLRVVETKNYYTKNPRNYNNTADANFSYIGSPKPDRILPDGSSIFCYVCGGQINISVDVNGPNKNPDRAGYDIFNFYIGSGKDTVLPLKQSKLYTEEELKDQPSPSVAGVPCSINSTQAGNGIGCAYYAFINKNPDDPTKGYWDSLE